jgi:chromosome segregation ATPase
VVDAALAALRPQAAALSDDAARATAAAAASAAEAAALGSQLDLAQARMVLLETGKAAAEAERSELLAGLDILRSTCAGLEARLENVGQRMEAAAAARDSLTTQLAESAAVAGAAVRAAEAKAVTLRQELREATAAAAEKVEVTAQRDTLERRLMASKREASEAAGEAEAQVSVRFAFSSSIGVV